uniref:Uncharacterized protein n=1 Tax=Anguilla anguilla TaxID=7936 RepID=A0A0E9PT72_ANGAN
MQEEICSSTDERELTGVCNEAPSSWPTDTPHPIIMRNRLDWIRGWGVTTKGSD